MAHPDPPTLSLALALALALALQQLRTACGLTQEELAERSRVSIRTISDIARGISRDPRRDTLQMLSAALPLDDEQAALLRPARYARTDMAEPSPGVTSARTPPELRQNSARTPLIGRAGEFQAVACGAG